MSKVEDFLTAASPPVDENANRVAELLAEAGITPDVINRIDKAVIRAVKITVELEIIRRIGKDRIDAFFR